jgi:RNA polymerase sigma-70 factor (ECF subfamily)
MDRGIDKLWDEFNEKLKSFILKRIPDTQAAEDVLQEVFIKIHTNMESLRDKTKLQSWVYQVTRNAIVDYYRSRKPVTEVTEQMAVSEDTPDKKSQAEISECIQALIEELPEGYKEAIYLTQYQGLTQTEMGKRLGLSPSGAKSRVQRAREKLKEMLLCHCHHELDELGIAYDYQPCCEYCCTDEID